MDTNVLAVLAGVAGVHYYYNTYRHSAKIASGKGKSVVISGCDSGFGKLLAIELSKMEFQVFAGCLTDAGAKALKAKDPRIITTLCDVTKEAEIQNWIRFVSESVGSKGLYAAVNNAGIGNGGRIDMGPVNMMAKTVEVNLIGTIRLTHACVPLLRKHGKGSRLVNVASLAGRIAGPGMGAYCASKFGVEAFSDCIRPELAQFGISVSIIEPGFHATEIIADLDNKFMDTWNAMDKETQALFGEKYKETLRARVNQLKGANPQGVVDNLVAAITSTIPKRRYLVGKDAKFLIYLSYLPSAIQDAIFGFTLETPAALLPAAKL